MKKQRKKNIYIYAPVYKVKPKLAKMDRSLTSGEKLNDPAVRSSMHTNEARHSRWRKQQQQRLMGSHRAPVADSLTENDRRLRGGGSSELEPASLLSSNADFTWYNRRFTMPNQRGAQQHRLEGGGGGAEASYPAAGCGKAVVCTFLALSLSTSLARLKPTLCSFRCGICDDLLLARVASVVC